MKMQIDTRLWSVAERETLLRVLERGGASAKYDSWRGYIHVESCTADYEKGGEL